MVYYVTYCAEFMKNFLDFQNDVMFSGTPVDTICTSYITLRKQVNEIRKRASKSHGKHIR
jgi:hypothetical protein